MKISSNNVIGQKNKTFGKGGEYVPVLFKNGKGGHHIQFVNTKNIDNSVEFSK